MEKIEKQQNDNQNECADFETAISATGYGKFHFILLIISIPALFGISCETSVMSYILPSAECDLKLSLLDKGILNAITYAGMIISGVFWGYLADTLGRKKLLVWGFLLDSVCVLCGSISQTKYILMVFKFLGGCLMCGPFAVLMSYITEFHATKYRSRIMMCTGIFSSMCTLLLPVLAWGILPQNWTLNIFDLLVLRSWQMFIAATALPSFCAGISIIFLPESPKFLMSQGRNNEAIKIFQLVYSINFGKSKEEYPIKTLIEEIPQKTDFPAKIFNVESSLKNEKIKKVEKKVETTSFREGLNQLKPMFFKPYLGHSLLVCLIQFFILMGLNTIRLWLPQLFTSISNYEEDLISKNLTKSSDLCEIIEYSVNKSNTNVASSYTLSVEDISCEVNITTQMYMNTIIVGVFGLVGYLIAGALINALGNKNIIVIGLLISGTCASVLYWAKSSVVILILSSFTVSVSSICSTALVGVAVSLFPTTLRTMIVSILMIFGRLGALIGNILFPIFMSLGCLPPFALCGLVLLASSLLSILLPKTHKTPLK